MDSLRFTHFFVATINRLITLPLFSACWVFSCFCNPLNSDMDYRIFNVHTWSFLCVRIHTGVGQTESESAQHFWLGKSHTHFSCAVDFPCCDVQAQLSEQQNFVSITSFSCKTGILLSFYCEHPHWSTKLKSVKFLCVSVSVSVCV